MWQRYKIEIAIIRPVVFRFTFADMKSTLRILIFFVWLLIFPFISLHAQKHESDKYGFGIKIGNDTIIYKDIEEIRVYPRNSKISHFTRYYSRLAQRVKKVYPYAQKANELLKKYEPQYYTLKTDKERRKLMKDIENQLLAEYKDDLKRMSISDGRVLIKLIDRETGKTGFTLIKEFRGGFSAAFWQGIARIFKNNLKDEYDPSGDDVLIEDIVLLIEFGYL
jgi:hypothetical protein